MLITIILWMYKETRSSYVENMKQHQQRADKAIDCYSELELELFKYINENSDINTVYEKMAAASFIMTSDLMKKCFEIKIAENEERRVKLLRELHSNLVTEIKEVKFNQHNPITFKSDDGVKFMEHYVKTKVAPFLYPLLQTFFNIVFLIVAVWLIVHLLSIQSMTEQIQFIGTITGVICYGLMINLAISLVIMKKRFKHTFINWTVSAFFIISPSILFLKFTYQGIVLVLIVIMYGFYLVSKSTTK
ncbi:hypothetical protein ACFSTH_12840 [Paenibacillus yanchengensis]